MSLVARTPSRHGHGFGFFVATRFLALALSLSLSGPFLAGRTARRPAKQHAFAGVAGPPPGRPGRLRRQVCSAPKLQSGSVPSSEGFWESDLGILRKHSVSTLSLPYLPEPGHVPPWAGRVRVVPHQVRRDIEQLEYLVSTGVLDESLCEYVVEHALPEYGRMLTFAGGALEGSAAEYLELEPSDDFAVFFGLSGKALHLHPGDALPEPALNAELDLAAVQQEYLHSEHRAIIIDGLLSQAALQHLRAFLLESMMWAEPKAGYMGAYLDTGFASGLLWQIDRELRLKMPRVLGGLELENAWAFMYDGSLGGIGTHADDAQVQVNLFLTPTEANMWWEDRSNPGGGLVIFGVGPPKDWDFGHYNNEGRNPRIREIVASSGCWNLTVPYVQNRAILFDSTYFHRTDAMSFKKGYCRRRINVTFLYGKRDKLVPAPVMSGQGSRILAV